MASGDPIFSNLHTLHFCDWHSDRWAALAASCSSWKKYCGCCSQLLSVMTGGISRPPPTSGWSPSCFKLFHSLLHNHGGAVASGEKYQLRLAEGGCPTTDTPLRVAPLPLADSTRLTLPITKSLCPARHKIDIN